MGASTPEIGHPMKKLLSVGAANEWRKVAWTSGLVLGLVWMTGCGSSAPPPKTPKKSVPTAAAASAKKPPPTQHAAAPSGKVKQGIGAIQARDFGKAKELLTAARAANPKDPQAVFNLGVAEQGLGNNDEAKRLYQIALRLDPKLTESSLKLSALLLDSGKPDDAAEAVRVVDAGLKARPNSEDLLMSRALAQASTGDYGGAAGAYAKLLSKGPDDPKLRLEYARVLGKAGQKEKALGELEKIAKVGDPELLIAAANIQGQMRDFNGCVGTLDTVVQKKPAPDALVRRALCKKELGDAAGEKADYEQALKLDDKFAPAYLYLGLHQHFVAKKDKDALAALEKARKFGSGTPIAVEADTMIATLKPNKK
jgi:tetratricopeptide (TPR) repeat protein